MRGIPGRPASTKRCRPGHPATLFALSCLLLGCAPLCRAEIAPDEAQRVLALLAATEDAWSQITDYTQVVEKKERLVDGELTEQTVFAKFRRPNSYYLKVLDGPNKGGELIYPHTPGSNLAVAHAGGLKGSVARFLRKTVILRSMVPTEFPLDDPSIIKGQHQTVLDTSLGTIIHRIARNVRTAIRENEGSLSMHYDCTISDDCRWRVDVQLPSAAGQIHVVQAGENLWSIATAYDRPMYSILARNPDMRDPEDMHPGQKIFIPRYYAAGGSFWISEASKLPVKLEIFDAGGELYESYVHTDVHLNLGLTDLDFDPANPAYRF